MLPLLSFFDIFRKNRKEAVRISPHRPGCKFNSEFSFRQLILLHIRKHIWYSLLIIRHVCVWSSMIGYRAITHHSPRGTYQCDYPRSGPTERYRGSYTHHLRSGLVHSNSADHHRHDHQHNGPAGQCHGN